MKKWLLKRVEAVWRSLNSNIHITDQCCAETSRSIARSKLTNNQMATNFSWKFAASVSSQTHFTNHKTMKPVGQFGNLIAQHSHRKFFVLLLKLVETMKLIFAVELYRSLKIYRPLKTRQYRQHQQIIHCLPSILICQNRIRAKITKIDFISHKSPKSDRIVNAK